MVMRHYLDGQSGLNRRGTYPGFCRIS